MVEQSKALGHSALGLCDRNGIYGVVRAFAQAQEIGHRLIVGAEVSLAVSKRRMERTELPTRARHVRVEHFDAPTLALLVRDSRGYENLCRLLTNAHADLPKGEAVLDLKTLAVHQEGLVAVVPGATYPGASDTPPEELFDVLIDAFGRDHAYVAAFRRFDGHDAARLESVEAWSRRYGLDVVASARPLYHSPDRKPLADVMHCIRKRTTLDQAGQELGPNAEAYLRAEEGKGGMRILFREREHWVSRAGEVANLCVFSLDRIKYEFPCELSPGETADEALERLVEEGAQRRYPSGVPSNVGAQIDKELRLIAELEVAPYFLSTYEIIEMARAKRILCQGRGSAANSAVCYALGITSVDPARSNLLFERFLSHERREPPDIDVDFEHERREEIIQEIYERHGRDRAAMVSEVISYRGKSALREVGRAFGLSSEQIERLSGLLTHWDSLDEKEIRADALGFDMNDPRVLEIFKRAKELEGFPRHLSIHVGGFVLSARSLSEVAPVEPARMKGRTVIPWDKDDIDTLRFFKVDVLGLGMLSAIRKCLAMIHDDGVLHAESATRPDAKGAQPKIEERFDPIDVLARVPSEDPAVYRLVSEADTVGVFQIESRAQMAMLPRLRPQRFYDLVVEVAIVRPGPIQGGMVHPYLRRRTGSEAITYPHENLVPILKRTLGIPLFQEQVMQIAITGAGYGGGEADQLRRDMAAWKKSGKLLRHRERLLEGFARSGISRQFSEALFEQIKGFGDYGFPESHAASFAVLVYASAWQKAHFPAHFACAILNSQPMGFYSPSSLVRDAQKHGVEVREVNVVSSGWDSMLEAPSKACRVKSVFPQARKSLRLGLRLVKGLGERTARAIEKAREECAFSNLHDLVLRARLEKDEVEALAEAGALEELVHGRRQALWSARAPRTEGLFARQDTSEPAVTLPALSPMDQLLFDYGRTGLSVSDHPLRHVREELCRKKIVTMAELQNTNEERASVAGLVLTRQRPGTASGIVFITLEDETGIANLVLYSRVFHEHRVLARQAPLLVAHGKVERHVTEARPGEFGATTPIVHLLVEKLERLDIPGIEKSSRDFH